MASLRLWLASGRLVRTRVCVCVAARGMGWMLIGTHYLRPAHAGACNWLNCACQMAPSVQYPFLHFGEG